MIDSKKPSNFQALFSAVGCICFHDKDLLLLKRNIDKSYPNHWGVPSGKINEDEIPIQAIIRELYEETKILLSADRLKLVNKFYITTSEMSFEYTLYYVDFDLIPSISINLTEHQEYRWFHIDIIENLELIPYVKETTLLAVKIRNQKFTFQLNLFGNEFNKHSEINIKLNDYLKKFSGLSKRLEISKNWITSFGPPGSGKTTTLKRLHDIFHNYQLFSDNKKILIQDTRLKRYLNKAVKEEKWLYYFFFQMEILPERFKQSFNSPDHSLIDESIYSTLAYSISLYKLGWISTDEFGTFLTNYHFYLNFLPPPSKIFYFYCSTETLIKRIHSRNRKIEEYYSYQYLEALNRGFEETAKQLCEGGFEVVFIDTEKYAFSEVIEITTNILTKIWT